MHKMAEKRAMLIIFLTVTIDMVGLGIIIPVMPALIKALTGEGIAQAAIYASWMLFVYACMQFLFAPVIGNLSDRFGRRPLLLLALSGLAIDYLIMGLANNLTWLFIGRLLAGIAGASHSVATAYVADISKGPERTKNFGMLSAAFGVGFILGPVIGGLLGELGPRVPLFAAAALAAANMLFAYFYLPESLPPALRRTFHWRRANPLGALYALRITPYIFGLSCVFFLHQFGGQVYPSIWSFFGVAKFSWSESMIGLTLGVFGTLTVIIQGGLLPRILAKFGQTHTAIIGLACSIIGLLGFGLAAQQWVIFILFIPAAMGGIALPAVQGMMSNCVGDDVQGELSGALASLISLSAILAPPIFAQVFALYTNAESTSSIPGAAFILAALIELVTLGLFIKILRQGKP